MLFYPKMIYILANNQGETKENHNSNVYGISKNQKVTRHKKKNKNDKSQKKNKLTKS